MHRPNRRVFLKTSGAAIAVSATAHSFPAFAGRKIKIGVIGAGKIGGAVGGHWVKAGHTVLFSSRHPDRLKGLVDGLGLRASAGWPREAAAFGEVILVSVPYGALPEIGRDFAKEIAGKVVLETGNPFDYRDGPMALAAIAKGVGRASQDHLPGTRLVRAFNTVPHWNIADDAHRKGELIAIPLASDDAAAMEIAADLVRDAGFEPVKVGTLAETAIFDVGSSVWGQSLSAQELRRGLGI
jgi:8-hydroxy-5-deazaflavin:NADPH oxidoreductase